MLKKILKFIIIINLLVGITPYKIFAGLDKNNEKIKIYILQGTKHPALDATTAGIIDGLKHGKYHNSNVDLQVEYAQGSVTLAAQIANKFVSNNPRIVVGIGTMASQAFIKYAKDKKTSLIFTTVTDPILANLTNTLNGSEENIAGVSNYIPLEPQLEMMKKIKPDIKILGFLYNPSEVNSISLIKKLEEICPKFGIKLVTQVAMHTTEVMQATQKLARSADAIFISNDSTALSAMQIINKVSKAEKIPVFVSDTDIVKDGALAALGPNQYALGKQTAKMIIRVLEGEDIASIPLEFPKNNELYLNLKAATEVGIAIPKELIDSADKILN